LFLFFIFILVSLVFFFPLYYYYFFVNLVLWGGIPTPHGPCSYCYSPYHHVKDCLTAVQFSNYSYEHMNTQLSRPRNDPYSDSYDPGWSNQSNISWHAQASENYALQFHELYYQAYPQFNDQAVYPPSNFHPPL
jgi:hypothetical protein